MTDDPAQRQHRPNTSSVTSLSASLGPTGREAWLVQLEEGPLVLTNVVGAEPEDVRIGMELELVAERHGPIGLPPFLDDEGYLTITDRLNDVIIRGGENVSAAEVEELLARMPGLAEVAVVAAPDRRLGEHACAFLRVLPNRAPPEMESVQRHLAGAGLARQKWPEELRVVDDFPLTPSGKVKKFVLRDQLRRGESLPPDLSRSEER
jgi:AMP-binding enzyme/acyl-CoA-associated DUF35 OB-fold domain-containing protein